MDAPWRTGPANWLLRSSHTAFINNNTLYVWGGYKEVAGVHNIFPSDEIWLCDLDSGTWERMGMTGDIPPALSGFCGSYVNGTLYIFAGCEPLTYTNQIFSVDLTEQPYSWKKVTDTKGTPPSPRNKHSCWVHRDRLIYFGGYGCKIITQNTSSTSFEVEEVSWKTIEFGLFKCWGWNNEVNVFDTSTATWSMPRTQGRGPNPRCCHAAAVLGSKGYISGGLENSVLDMFCLDLETWTWTQFDVSMFFAPLGRSMFTMTPTSDHTLLIYGGLSTYGKTLNDAWQFNTLKRRWTRLDHPHKDKPRVCHTACLGPDNDVVVFGGSSNMHIYVDSMTVLRSPSYHHCGGVLIFQTQPYSLFRLCMDFVGRNVELFGKQLNWLPSSLRSKIERRSVFFSAATL